MKPAANDKLIHRHLRRHGVLLKRGLATFLIFHSDRRKVACPRFCCRCSLERVLPPHFSAFVGARRTVPLRQTQCHCKAGAPLGATRQNYFGETRGLAPIGARPLINFAYPSPLRGISEGLILHGEKTRVLIRNKMILSEVLGHADRSFCPYGSGWHL